MLFRQPHDHVVILNNKNRPVSLAKNAGQISLIIVMLFLIRIVGIIILLIRLLIFVYLVFSRN